MSKPIPSAATIPSGHHAVSSNAVKTTSCMAIASMVCGIVGLFFFGIVLGSIAVILGFVAKNEIASKPEELQGVCQANAGIICGIIAIAVWIVLVVVWVS